MNAIDLVIRHSCPYDVDCRLSNIDDYSVIRDKETDRIIGCRNTTCWQCWVKDRKEVADEYRGE